jgi:dTDP-3-amino-3,4,6-trideoxy-alpha-D-glucose transaminase
VVRTPRRDSLQAALAADGIDTVVLYPVPVHRQPAYAESVSVLGGLETTENLCQEILSLPMGPHLTDALASRVASAVRRWVATS